MRLSGKRAFVTGGRQGIGRAIVDAFRREGAQVTTCGRGPRPDDLPPEITWQSLDVTDPAAVTALAEPLEILVNNAGIQ
ncbi:MAG: SDR family NAD(P)-dependent oxidoreductase, partial [Pseudomonadota bacterium]